VEANTKTNGGSLMAKSNALPITELITDLSDDRAAWPLIVEAFFKAAHAVVTNRYRWITRMNRDKTVKDHVLEDQGEFLLVSCRYGPDMYVRAGVKDLIDRQAACLIYGLIQEARWSHPKLKQVLVRIGDRTVPLEAMVRNESHRHSFCASEVVDITTHAQAEASWYLAKEERRKLLVGMSLPRACRSKGVADSLDILCRGDMLWAAQDGDVFKAYLLDAITGKMVTVRYYPDTGMVHRGQVTRPPKFLNPVAVVMYKKHLQTLTESEGKTGREWALGALCEYYKEHMHAITGSLLNIEE